MRLRHLFFGLCLLLAASVGSAQVRAGLVNLATMVTGVLGVVNGGTGVTSSTGTGSAVLSTSPTLTTPNLGTPSALTLTNATGLPCPSGILTAYGCFIEEANPTGSSFSFSSLGSFTHLHIIWVARGDTSATSTTVNCNLNGDNGNNYDLQQIAGSGSTASGTETFATACNIGSMAAATAPAGSTGAGEVTVLNYRANDGVLWKSMYMSAHWRTSNSAGGQQMRLRFMDWRNTSPVTSMAFSTSAGNFATGSKFTLYGTY